MAAAIVALGLACSSAAGAQPTDKKTCLAAADDGQKLRDDGKLIEARDKFLVCASRGCPSVIVKQCDEWVSEVDRDTPTVLFRVFDASGKELIDVRVLVDGEKIADSIAGQPLPLEPRAHTFRFELANGRSVEERAVMRVGEKGRVIEARFAAESTVPASAERRSPSAERRSPTTSNATTSTEGFHVPLLGWVGAGVFVAGAATTTVFALLAHGDESDLRATCAPNCAKGDRDAIQSKLLVANIGLGVGLAGLALGVATTVLANRHGGAARASGGLRIVPGLTGIAGTF